MDKEGYVTYNGITTRARNISFTKRKMMTGYLPPLPSGVSSYAFTGMGYPSSSYRDIDDREDEFYYFVTATPRLSKIQQKTIDHILVSKEFKIDPKKKICFCNRYPLKLASNMNPPANYSIHEIKDISMVTISARGIFNMKNEINLPRLGYLSIRELCKDLEITGRAAWGGQLIKFK